MKIFKRILRKFRTFFNNFRKKTNFLDAKSLVCYICGNEALPLPLEAEEEQILLEELALGNDNAKEKLIEHNLRLVVYISKKFENTGLELEDLISIGAIGLIKAVQTYKFDKQIKLATYASRCIENEILMYLRKANKSINDLSLDDGLVNDEEGNSLSLGEMIPDDKSITDEMELNDQKIYIINAIKELNDREQKIMYMRYGLNGYDELTQKEVADTMHISQSYISRLEKKILKKLKKDMLKNM